MDLLSWLERWYLKNCNGDWEHSYGIKIETLDNPGWSVEIDLADTNLELRYFEVVKIQRSESNWIVCQIEDDIFKGRGGPENLTEILDIFSKWAEAT
ncbi:MAG: immunity 53 family protein [Nitrospirota bacterium]